MNQTGLGSGYENIGDWEKVAGALVDSEDAILLGQYEKAIALAMISVGNTLIRVNEALRAIEHQLREIHEEK